MIQLRLFVTLLLLAAGGFRLWAQQIANVHALQEGKQIVITYDITGGSSTDRYDVSLLYAQDNNDWRQATLGLSGDVGAGLDAGTNKTMRWSPLQELSKLTGSGYRFKVKATIKNSCEDVSQNMISVKNITGTDRVTIKELQCENYGRDKIQCGYKISQTYTFSNNSDCRLWVEYRLSYYLGGEYNSNKNAFYIDSKQSIDKDFYFLNTIRSSNTGDVQARINTFSCIGRVGESPCYNGVLPSNIKMEIVSVKND